MTNVIKAVTLTSRLLLVCSPQCNRNRRLVKVIQCIRHLYIFYIQRFYVIHFKLYVIISDNITVIIAFNHLLQNISICISISMSSFACKYSEKHMAWI